MTSSRFPPHLTGRVSTALNQLAFLAAFAIQWGVGLTVELLGQRGVAEGAAYRATFAGLLLAKSVAIAWSAPSRKPSLPRW